MSTHPDPIDTDQAIALLKAEEVVAIPTETVYGLAGRMDSKAALNTIFAVKKRPFFDPLILHIADLVWVDQLTTHGLGKLGQTLAEKFWPGPLTLILPKSDLVDPLITSGLTTVAIRMPKHPVAEYILKKIAVPLAAPSANLFGRTSPTSAEHVIQEFRGQIPVVDGGACAIGIESTVVQIHDSISAQIDILRPGHISEQDLRLALKDSFPNLIINKEASVASPGHMKHHYQPTIPMVWMQSENGSMDAAREILQLKTARLGKELKLDSDPRIAARELYHKLRELSESGADFIYHIRLSNKAGWEAIDDRLSKAATVII